MRDCNAIAGMLERSGYMGTFIEPARQQSRSAEQGSPAMTHAKLPGPSKARSASPAADERSARAASRGAASPRVGQPRRGRSDL